MDKRIDLFNIFKQEGKLKILHLYASQEVINDPYEKTKTNKFLNPLPIKGLVRQISQEALRWKYYGQLPSGSIEIITEKKNKTLFITADKIKYNNIYYHCWRDDSQNFGITERSDYIIVILSRKNLNAE